MTKRFFFRAAVAAALTLSVRVASADPTDGSPTITIEVDEPGAEVLVDGRSIGRAPFAGAIDLTPGHHVVVARADGVAPVSRTIDARAGESASIFLRLHPLRDDVVGYDMPKEQSFAVDPARRPSVGLIVAGGTISVVALTTAAALNFAANGGAHAAIEEQTQIRAAGGGSSTCASPSPRFAAACQSLASDLSSRDRLANLSIAGYLVAGGVAIATLAYAFWPRSPVRLAPSLGANGGGVTIAGAF